MKKASDISGMAKSSLISLKSLRTTCMTNVSDEFHPFESLNEGNNININDDYRHPLEKLVLGIDEAELILRLVEYIDVTEANSMKLNSMIMRLSEENSWLRDEITVTQTRLNGSEERNIELEEKIKDYELKLELRKYDDPLPMSYSNNQLSDSINLSESTLSGQLAVEEPPSKPPGRSSTSGPTATVLQSSSSSAATAAAGQSSSVYNYELPDHLKTLHSLITDYSAKGRYEVATALCKQAIQNEMTSISSKRRILTTTDDNNSSTGTVNEDNSDSEYCSLDIATLQNILALVYRDQGNYLQAVDLLNNSLGIREKLLGQNHPLIAITLNNIAILQAKVGKLREAENMCRRALAIREQHLGNNHPDVAKQLFNLALLVQNQARFEEVEQIYKKALSIYADNFGPDNINVIKTRNNIAYVHLKQNNFVQAEIIFKELLTCWHERLSGSPQTSSGSSNGGNNHVPSHEDRSSCPKKPLWVIVEDKNQVGSGTGPTLRNNSELQAILPLYSLATDLPKEEFDLFSSTISYLVRAYKGQNKLVEADLLEEWLSRSIRQFDSCKPGGGRGVPGTRQGLLWSSWSTSIQSGVDVSGDDYGAFELYSPTIGKAYRSLPPNTYPGGSGAALSSGSSNDATSDSFSRYSIRRIGNKISSKFKSFRSADPTAPTPIATVNNSKGTSLVGASDPSTSGQQS